MRTINLITADDQCDCCDAYTIKLPRDFIEMVEGNLVGSPVTLHTALAFGCMKSLNNPEFIAEVENILRNGGFI